MLDSVPCTCPSPKPRVTGLGTKRASIFCTGFAFFCLALLLGTQRRRTSDHPDRALPAPRLSTDLFRVAPRRDRARHKSRAAAVLKRVRSIFPGAWPGLLDRALLRRRERERSCVFPTRNLPLRSAHFAQCWVPPGSVSTDALLAGGREHEKFSVRRHVHPHARAQAPRIHAPVRSVNPWGAGDSALCRQLRVRHPHPWP